jgi:hypothetical protein
VTSRGRGIVGATESHTLPIEESCMG